MSGQEGYGVEWAPVMPFICCRTKGGPFEDRSFVAGMRLREVWDALERHEVDSTFTVETELVDQIDLVAMHFGYQAHHEPWIDAPDEWSFVWFSHPIRADKRGRL